MGKNGKVKKDVLAIFGEASMLQKFIDKNSQRFATLTEQEIEVLALIAKGLKTSAITKELAISITVAQNHRTNIRKKLSINSRADYIKYALAFGLITF